MPNDLFPKLIFIDNVNNAGGGKIESIGIAIMVRT